MKTNTKVKINGYRVLGNGELREKISVEVLKDGELFGKFAKLSGGQAMRLKLASYIALNKIMNESCVTGGLNFLALDEIIDGVDAVGNVEIFKSLQLLDIPVTVISHNNVEDILQGEYHRIDVEYANGTSKVK
jgi:exonuclease SbcC